MFTLVKFGIVKINFGVIPLIVRVSWITTVYERQTCADFPVKCGSEYA